MFTASWRFSPRTQLTPHRLSSYTALGLFLNLLLIWLFLCPLEQSDAHPHARQAAAGSPLPLVKAAVTTQSSCPAITAMSPAIGQIGSNVTITGTGFTGVTAVKFSNNVNASFTINSDTQITAIVPAGVITGPITISKTNCSDVQSTSFNVCPNPPSTLQIDNGMSIDPLGVHFTDPVPFPRPEYIYWVNRLTPPSYPATLSRVSIFFLPYPNLPFISAGQNITVLVGANSDGDANIDSTNFQTLATTIQAMHRFNDYNIAPLTINSGDFVIGYHIALTAIAATSMGLSGRSHYSLDGVDFSSTGTTLMIRGQIFTSGCGSGGCPTITLGPQFIQSAQLNQTYNQTIMASGGAAPYTFTLSDGSLPPGLTLNTSTGVLSGTTSTTGYVAFTIRATDANGCFGERTYSLSPCNLLGLAPATLPWGLINTGYNQTIQLSGADPSTRYELLDGALPPGISLSSTTGLLSGTPTQPGSFTFTVVGINWSGCTGIRNYTLIIGGCTGSISPTSQAFDAGEGTGSVSVTAANNCLWAASSNATWITITSGNTGDGNGTVIYRVASNTNMGNPPRTGTMTIAGQSFTITQDRCTYSIAPTSQFLESPGGNGNISVVTANGCRWFAAPRGGGLGIFSNITPSFSSFGTGNGTITYSVTPNNTFVQRTGIIDIYDWYFTANDVGTLLNTFTITQESNARFIRIDNASATPGNPVSVPINLVSKGNEHALGLSLNYDPALLSNPVVTAGSDTSGAAVVPNASQAAQGRFGFLLSLPGTQSFTAGVRQAAVVTFNVIPVTPGTSISITSGDQPIVRQVSDVNGTNLPTTFTNGTVTIATSPYEADVAPRSPFGMPDGQVTVADWVVVGNVAAGLDSPANSAEFQKADCAPRAGLGDGAINLADWSQAGRYAAALDPLTLAGGPTSRPAVLSSSPLAPAQQRVVRAVNTVFQRGQLNTLAVELDAQGNENTLGFSLNYDTNLLSFSSAALGNGASGATLLVNPNQTNSGKVGIAVGLLGGQHFAAGTRQIVFVNFNVAASGPTVSTPVSFGDQPIARQVVDVNSNLVSATYANTTITILQNGCQYTVSPLNQAFGANGGTDSITVMTGSGCGWNATSNDSFINITAGSSGSGNGTVSYAVAVNNGLARNGTITIAGQNITIQQNGPSLQFYPLATPVRLLDTRPGASPGACSQPNMPIAGQTARSQPGRNLCMIPGNAVALTGNVTTVLSDGGFLTLYPSDVPQPTIASTNYGVNEIINNVFTVGLGVDGAFNIFANTTTDVVVDVTGYYAPPGASGLYFHPLPAPVRLLETRAGLPVGCVKPGAPLVGGMDSMQTATTACTGIPAGARSVVGNATTVSPAGGGYLTLYPADVATAPLVASSNYNTGQIVNGPFTVGLSAAGQFKIFTTHTTDLVVDVLGYYSTEANDVNGAGLLFNPLPRPVRLLETRPGLPVGCFKPGQPLAGGSETLQTARGLCDGVTIPANALGVVGNATVVFPIGRGFLTLWPSLAARPLVATSNYNPGDVGNRHFIVGLGNADGAFQIYTHATTDLVIDLSGYFAP